MKPEQYGFDRFYAMAIQNEVDETDFFLLIIYESISPSPNNPYIKEISA